MSFYSVDDSRCTRCGICVALCPAGIISLEGDNVPQVGYSRAATCLKCGQCMVYCPMRANSLAFQVADEVVRSSDIPVSETEAALNLLKTRRSVRCFKPEAVADQDFAAIFDTVRMAPSSSNSQTVRWIVSQTPEKTKEIRDMVLCWFREVLADEPNSRMGFVGRRAIALAEEGKDMILRGAPNVVMAVMPQNGSMREDGVIALTYFELAAHAIRLGCCWGGFLTVACRRHQPLREYLGIREEEYFCGAQMIGYPERRPVRQFPPRRMPGVTWIK